MKKYYLCLLLVVLLCIPLIDLLHPGLPITHDGQDHVARIANFYTNLREGVFIPRWGGNLNWSYGHPVLMFLYPASSYTASLFHFIGFSLVDSTKLVFAFAFIASGLTMYLWLQAFLNRQTAFVGALLYTYAPYRFVDLYVRGAIGEHMAFIFPPLVLYAIYKLYKTNSYKYVALGAISLGLFILSHNAIVLMFLPIIALYVLFLIFQTQSKTYFAFSVVIIFALGFGLSAFFWLPGVMEGKYTLRDIVTANEYATRYVNPIQFLYGQWNYGISGQFTVQIGIIQWLAVIGGIVTTYFLKKKKNNLWVLILGAIVIFFLTLWIMTSYSQFMWATITILQKFQFPWRFLSVTTFLTALLGAVTVWVLPKKWSIPMIILITIGLLVFNRDYWYAKDFLQKNQDFYSGIYNSTTDTGESSPIWSVRFMEKRPEKHMEVINGNARITPLKRTTTSHTYKIESTGESRIRENTVYFPGWNVYINDKLVPVEFQDPSNRGLITFYVPKGSSLVTIQFEETKLRQVSNWISVSSIALLVVYLLLGKGIWKKFQ